MEQKRLNQLWKATKFYIDADRKIIVNNVLNFIEKEYDKRANALHISWFDEAIDMAIIVSRNIGLGLSAILSVLLFRAYQNKIVSDKKISDLVSEKFSKQVINILQGLQKVNSIDKKFALGITLEQLKSQDNSEILISKELDNFLSSQGEIFKNFFVAMGGDVRVTIILLAYHYFKVLNIDKYENYDKKIQIALESRYLYAPLAHQLGLYQVKTLLEEQAMKNLNKRDYEQILQLLEDTEESREKYIKKFIEPVRKMLDEIGIKAKIKGRSKSIHSIWKKIKNKFVEIDGVFDLLAIRIIILNKYKTRKSEVYACWNVYSKITEVFEPMPDRLRDWITMPKSSGYESLHTTVRGPENRWVEVQIRTKRMDDIAENGDAAHWRYKEVKGDTGHLDWITAVKELLSNPLKADDEVETQNFGKEIYVFTPKGELIQMPVNSTVLDFAYRIHSKIGDRCIGAKINGKMQGIRHKLKNADTVEILTSSTQRPTVEWLDIVVSNRTKARIRKSLKDALRDRINEGKENLANVVEKFREKYSKPNFQLDDKKLLQLRKKFGYQKISDFYLDIQDKSLIVSPEILYNLFVSSEELSAKEIIAKLLEQKSQETNKSTKDYLIIDKINSGIKYEFAKCCNPIPGDEIFAFVSATRGTKIHKVTCPNAKDLITKYPYRIMPALWKASAKTDKFKVKITIKTEKNNTIVAHISNIIVKQAYLDLLDFVEKDTEQYKEYEITVKLNSTTILEEFLSKLRQIKGIYEVKRDF